MSSFLLIFSLKIDNNALITCYGFIDNFYDVKMDWKACAMAW